MKTSLRERWQEVAEEIERTKIPEIHLLTVDDNIPKSKAMEMSNHNIIVVTFDWVANSQPLMEMKNIISFEEYLFEEIPPYSYFSLVKSYDKRGYIIDKGLWGMPIYWRKGKWYYFNKEGKLEKTINYDEVSKFTFEEVEDFCLSKGMKLRRGYKGEGALIRRIYIPGVSYNCWEITYILVGDEYGDYYRLDLQTGKVLSYRKYEYII